MRVVVVADIIALQRELKLGKVEFMLLPPRWQAFPVCDLLEWHLMPFDPDSADSVPTSSGLYSFIVQPNVASHPAASYLMYVGRTSSLRRRYREYMRERNQATGRPKIVQLLNEYSNHVHFCYTELAEARLTHVEEELIKAFMPPANDQVPAELRPGMAAF